MHQRAAKTNAEEQIIIVVSAGAEAIELLAQSRG
jgi:hypothetical protein